MDDDDKNTLRKAPNCWHFPTINRIRDNSDERRFSMCRSRIFSRNNDSKNKSQKNQQDSQEAAGQRGLCCQMSTGCPNSDAPKTEVIEETENLTIVSCPYTFANENEFDFDPPQASTPIEKADPTPPVSPMPSRQQPQQDLVTPPRQVLCQQAPAVAMANSQPLPECQCDVSPPEMANTRSHNNNNSNNTCNDSLQDDIWQVIRNARNQPQPQYRPMEQQPPTLDSTYFRPGDYTDDDDDDAPCTCDPENSNIQQPRQFMAAGPIDDCNPYRSKETSQLRNNASAAGYRSNSPHYCPPQSANRPLYANSQGPQTTSHYQMRRPEVYQQQQYQPQRVPIQAQGHMTQRSQGINQNVGGMHPGMRRTAIETQTDFDTPTDLPLASSTNRTQNPAELSHHASPCKNAGQMSNMDPADNTQYRNLPAKFSKMNVKFCENIAKSLSSERLARANERAANTNDNLSRQQCPPQQQYQSNYLSPPKNCQNQINQEPSFYQTQSQYSQDPPCHQQQQQQEYSPRQQLEQDYLPQPIRQQQVFSPQPSCPQQKEFLPKTPCQQQQEYLPKPPCQQQQEYLPKPPCQQQQEYLPNPPCQQQEEYSLQPPCQQQEYQQPEQPFAYDVQGASGLPSCTCDSMPSATGPGPNSNLDPCPTPPSSSSRQPCCSKSNVPQSFPMNQSNYMNQSFPQQNMSPLALNSSKRSSYDIQFDALVLDTYFPGIIDDTVNNKVNFNEFAYKMLFGGNVPSKPKSDPMTLIEAFHLRLDWERNDCSKNHFHSRCSPLEVEDHFRTKNKSELNNALAAYMRAESAPGVSNRVTSPQITANINRTETDFLGLPIKTTIYTGTTSPGV